jgi:hypothetical protein
LRVGKDVAGIVKRRLAIAVDKGMTKAGGGEPASIMSSWRDQRIVGERCAGGGREERKERKKCNSK